MRELGGDEPLADHPPCAELGRIADEVAVVRAAPHEAGLALQPRQRVRQRCLTRGEHRLLNERVAERVHGRHRLGHGEGEIESRDSSCVRCKLGAVRGEPGVRCEPSKHRT